MSGLAKEKLETIINELRETYTEHKTDDEDELFTYLDYVFRRDENKNVQEEQGVIIEQFPGGDDEEMRKLIPMEYKRMTTLYHRRMYNKFFVPVWAAARNPLKGTENTENIYGYVLHPRLTPLRDVLISARCGKMPEDKGKLTEIDILLRQSIAPIALAIDALHTELPNRRMMYYHRDICVDTIRMSVRKDVSVMEGKYDDARLQISKLTRESHQYDLAIDGSEMKKYDYRKYHYHPELKSGGTEYERKHDWYSFGVYILEVLHLLFPMDTCKGISDPDALMHCFTDARKLKSHISALIKEHDSTLYKFISQYISIAVRCLALDEVSEPQGSLKLPPKMKRKLKSRTEYDVDKVYSLEYELHDWTAQLWWMYEDRRPMQYTAYSHHQREDETQRICQACLLCPTVPLWTQMHCTRGEPKCGKNCIYHCARCYMNGERKFCVKQHGTTSTFIGHRFSYALLLYGKNFRYPNDLDACERSVTMVQNTLKHKLICGIPEKNILIGRLYDVKKKEDKKTTLSAADALKQYCEEMRELMYGKYSITCANDAQYNLFILYCGHGRDKAHPGDWCPADENTDVIENATIHKHISSLWDCPNKHREQPECNTRCVMVDYIMEHCYAAVSHPDSLNVNKSANFRISAPRYGKRLKGAKGGTPDISHWLCQLLRSNFDEKCVEHKPDESVDVEKRCNVCTEIKTRIKGSCGGAYIDSLCLNIHAGHMIERCGYTTDYVPNMRGENGFPLAYYSPGGVHLNVFSYKADGDMLHKLDFVCETVCVKIKMEINRKVKGNVALLTTRTVDHSKYDLVCDDDVNDALESSVLIYRLITKPIKVTLVPEDLGKGEEITMTLELDETDMDQVVDRDDPHVFPSGHLPNILVYIVHHLSSKYGNDGTEAVPTVDRIAQPEDSSTVGEKATEECFLETLAGSEVSLKQMEQRNWRKLKDRVRKIGKRKDLSVSQVKDSAVIRLAFSTRNDTTELLLATEGIIKGLLKDLRHSNSSNEVLEPVKISTLLKSLSDDVKSEDAQKSGGVRINRFDIEHRPERYLAYKKLTSVYNRNMYNKFFVPVWAAAMDSDQTKGYILYPRLTSVQEVLQDLRKAKGNEMELCKVLRLCFAPIALAIDSLHTEQRNRPMYLHHDVCIDNVYMKVRKNTDREGKETVEYDDARLQIAGFAQWSQEYVKYHHHSELSVSGAEYQRRHDWHSFGVYILEVLHTTFSMDPEVRFQEVSNYDDVGDLRKHISSLDMRQAHKETILQYMDIAVKCLHLKEDISRVCNYKVPEEFKQRFSSIKTLYNFHIRFEYRISPCTAELLWLYEVSRPDLYKTFKHSMEIGNEEVSVCQACLLNPTGEIPTRIYSESNGLRCHRKCVYYCTPCYRNGERKFCTEQHGTTSTILGGHFSYALLLYGEEFIDSSNKDAFKRSAHLVQNALQHKLICGIPETNILIRPLYDVTKREDKKTTLSAADALKQHCEEMNELIHGEDSITCPNDAGYRMFILYCGYGHAIGHHGDCRPTEYETITKIKRDLFLESLWQCTKSSKGQQACESSCVCSMLSCVMDCCRPEHQPPRFAADTELNCVVIGGHSTCGRAVDGSSDLCRWLSQFFRSTRDGECTEHNHCVPSTSVLVSRRHIDACTNIRLHIEGECLGEYVDSECLRIHTHHIPNSTTHVYCAGMYDDPSPLAYYNPSGVYLKVLPFKQDMVRLNIPFDCELTREAVEQAVFTELKSQSEHKSDVRSICLLTNRTDGYSKYELVSDGNISDVLTSSVLFYHVINTPVQVSLRMYNTDDELLAEQRIVLPVDVTDLDQMVSKTRLLGELPSILVYIVHYTRWLMRSNIHTSAVVDPVSLTSEKTAVIQSFIERLIGADTDVKWLTVREWQRMEDIAMTHSLEEGNGFTVQPTEAGLSVEFQKLTKQSASN